MNRFRFELSKLLKLAVPVIFSQLGNISMGLVDTYVVGKVSPSDVAGVAAGNSIAWPIFVVAIGLLVGMDIVISQSKSQKAYETVRACLGQGILLSIVLSLIISPVLYYGSHLISITGAQPEIIEKAVPYVKALALSTPFLILFNCLQKYWQALEIATPITIIIVIANILNYFLDEAFVLGRWGIPKLGAEGVGYATLYCRIIMCIAIIVLTLILWNKKNSTEIALTLQDLKVRSGILKQLAKLGSPAASQIGLEVLAFNLVTLLVARLGVQELAAHHIVMSIVSTTFMFPMGLSIATSIRVGSRVGTKNYHEADIVARLGTLLSTIIMGIFGLIIYLFPALLIGFFTNDRETLAIATSFISLCALFQIVDGIQVTMGGALRGISDTRTSVYSNLVGFYLVGFPVSITACFFLDQGLWGLWLGLAVGLLIVSVINSMVWFRKIDTMKKHLNA